MKKLLNKIYLILLSCALLVSVSFAFCSAVDDTRNVSFDLNVNAVFELDVESSGGGKILNFTSVSPGTQNTNPDRVIIKVKSNRGNVFSIMVSASQMVNERGTYLPIPGEDGGLFYFIDETTGSKEGSFSSSFGTEVALTSSPQLVYTSSDMEGSRGNEEAFYLGIRLKVPEAQEIGAYTTDFNITVTD